MKKYLYLACFLLSPTIAMATDITALPDLGTPATALDGIVTYDNSAAEGSRQTELKFDNTATNCLNGQGGWSAYQAYEATLTDIADGTIAEDLVNTANPWADNEVADNITASSYLALAGGTLTGELVADELGIEGQPTDAISDCSSYAVTSGGIFYDDSEGKWKKCQDNVLSDLDTNTGSATAFNDIADATDAGSIALAGYMQTITSTLNSAGANITMTNTTVDLTADVSFFDFKYTDDGYANGFFMRGYDNAGADLKWSIGADGAFSGASFTTNGADGTHYIAGLNTAALSSTPTDGNLAFLSDRYFLGDGADYNDFILSKELVDTEAEFESILGFNILGDTANSVASSNISTIVESIAWNSAGTSSDGTQCGNPTNRTINSGPIIATTICTDNDASTIYGHAIMPDSWDGGTVTMESEYLQTAADTAVLNGDITCMCRGAGETVNNTWGTEIAIDDAAVSGSNIVDHTTSAAITCDGTCAAGDTLYWRYQMDATGTTTAAATLHFIGWKMEYTSNVGD